MYDRSVSIVDYLRFEFVFLFFSFFFLNASAKNNLTGLFTLGIYYLP